MPYMEKMAGQGSKITLISGHIYEVSQNDQVIGYFDRQSAVGYAGPIEVLVFIGTDGYVKDLNVIKQTETRSFFNKVIAEGFVESLLNKEANSRFVLGEDLDGVANATYTSKGISEAVRKASHNIAVTQLGMEVPKAKVIKPPIEDYLILGLLLSVFVFYKLKWIKLRYLTLFAGFIIGYWQKSLLSLGNFSSVLAGTIPWENLAFWFFLLLGVLLLILASGRNLYCYWVCPYGALSELLGALGKFGRLNYKPCERSVKRFRHLRLFLAWCALVFAFFMKNPGISSYEIFAPLFAWEGEQVQWLILPIMLFGSIFILRFWCRFFCPVGGVLDFLVQLRRNCGEWLKTGLKKCEASLDRADRVDCSSSAPTKLKGKSLIFDIFVLVCAGLILAILLQNAGLI